MQEVAVRHATDVLRARHVDFASVKCVDIGGSRTVFLVRAEARPHAVSVIDRLRRRLGSPRPTAPVCEVTRNPVLELFANVTLLDHGFTVDLLNTDSDLRGDFLDDNFIGPLRDSFGVVLSFDTLEHVEDPFRFCRNLVAVASGGGLIYVQTVFSWPYHPSPQDYFRYSPEGLRVCFRDTHATVLESGWIVAGESTFVLLQKNSPCG